MKKALAEVIIIVLSLSLTSQIVAEEPKDVSIIQLIADSNKYDSKFVRIIGFVRLEFEGNAIYLTQGDYEHALTKNGLWLGISDDVISKYKDLNKFDKKYCLIEGIFNAKNTGHMGLFSGAIEKITRFEVWEQDQR